MCRFLLHQVNPDGHGTRLFLQILLPDINQTLNTQGVNGIVPTTSTYSGFQASFNSIYAIFQMLQRTDSVIFHLLFQNFKLEESILSICQLSLLTTNKVFYRVNPKQSSQYED